MTDPITTAIGVVVGAFTAIGGAAVAAVKYTLRRHIARIDDHGDRIAEMEKHMVSDTKLDTITGRFETAVGEVHKRLDDLYNLLLNKAK